MRKQIVLAGLLLATFGTAAYADDDWAGLYVGFDPRSGSTDQVSVVPTGKGTYDIILVTDRYSLCGEKPGWVTGTGVHAGDHLEVEVGERACADGSQPKEGHAPGARFDLIDDDDILKSTPRLEGAIPLYYHRVSAD